MAFDEAARAKALAKRRENKAKRDLAAQNAQKVSAMPETSPAPEVTPVGEAYPTNFLSGFVKRLEVHEKEPGYEYHWFNDEKGGSRLRAALDSGWTFVERKDGQLNAAVTPRNTDLGSRVQECVGTNENGGAMFAFLMRIPIELFNKHQEARIAYNRSLMAQIKGGQIGMKSGDGRYSAANPPPGGTSLPGVSVDTKLYR